MTQIAGASFALAVGLASLSYADPVPLLAPSLPPGLSVLDHRDLPPPKLALISVDSPDARGRTRVRGAPGAVPGGKTVLAATLAFSIAKFTTARPDGSFQIDILSAPGAWIQVRYAPDGYPAETYVREQSLSDINGWPGTLMRVGFDHEGKGLPFADAAVCAHLCFSTNSGKSMLWFMSGNLSSDAVDPGGTVSVSGTVGILNPKAAPLDPKTGLLGSFRLEPVFFADGRETAAGFSYASRRLTPTGLPIEGNPLRDYWSFHDFRIASPKMSFAENFTLPKRIPEGLYRLSLTIHEADEFEAAAWYMNQKTNELLFTHGATIGILRVGSPQPPRLEPALLMDNPSQGQRGTFARGTENVLAPAGPMAFHSGRLILPPRDPRSRRFIRYRLEPFFPFISAADRYLPTPPPFALRLPGGELEVWVTAPSGRREVLGPHKILQNRTGQANTRTGVALNVGGGNPGGIYQLTTLNDDFSVAFKEYGRHEVSLKGWVEDTAGRRLNFSGDFDLWAAETLDVELASLPGTPFEIGDRLSAAVNVFPGVQAEIEIEFELHPLDGGEVIRSHTSGTAGPFGYFDGGGESFLMSVSGEYLVTVRARYEDSQKRLWMGTRRWGGGVANAGGRLIAHGKRGFDAGSGIQPAWFERLKTGLTTGTSNHMHIPYFSGDIAWASGDDAMLAEISAQDRLGKAHPWRTSPGFLEDEMLVRTLSNGPMPIQIDASQVFVEGYAYHAMERPGVRVREGVVDGGTGYAEYWKFNDMYLAQVGMGSAGDLPNDIKWQFGSVVFKPRKPEEREIATYASLWVHASPDDSRGSRVFPPFRGAAGGPDGGPIMKLKGEEIDLFFLPTGIHPGALVVTGDSFVFSGHIGPPLASKLEWTIVSPSGKRRSFKGQANRTGYFHASETDFMIDEPGRWTVSVRVYHDGITSAGLVGPAIPEGGILGTDEGRFSIYAVEPKSPRLEAGLPTLKLLGVDSMDLPLRIKLQVPREWTDVSAHHTIRMPGFVLQSGALPVRNGSVLLTFDPLLLSKQYPNLDLWGRSEQVRGLSDEIMLSVFIEGRDSSGRRVFAGKLLTLFGEDLYNLN